MSQEKRYFNCLKERVLFKCLLLMLPAQGRIWKATSQTGTLPKTHFQESDISPTMHCTEGRPSVLENAISKRNMCVYLCFNVLVSVNTSTTTTTLRLSYFQLNLTSLSQQMAVFSSISQNWILMNSTMNSQARNYFPISPHDIPPSLCISGINT